VLKRYSGQRLVGVVRRVLRGSAEAIAAVLARTGTGQGINTSYIERLNATLRASLAPLVRRGRALLAGQGRLQAAMYLVGCAYNFCWEHDSLRQPTPAGSGRKWQGRTPAMAAGLTDRRWQLGEVLATRLPPPTWRAPRKRGWRRRRRVQPAPQPVAA
jgi:hypothetical protein